MKTPPPDIFRGMPMGSILQKSESESTARNIMIVRTELGSWDITYEEYRSSLEADGIDACSEDWFNQVYKHIADPLGAITFAPGWTKAYREWDSKN